MGKEAEAKEGAELALPGAGQNSLDLLLDHTVEDAFLGAAAGTARRKRPEGKARSDRAAAHLAPGFHSMRIACAL